MFKLIIHIGHGKTGSSSIQQSLLESSASLEAQRTKYLGIMLEHATNAQRPEWQVKSGSDRFFVCGNEDQANHELAEILDHEIERLQDTRISTAIWSNEWLLTRSQFVLPALCQLRDRGIKIEVQCYVRRHDKWAQSAYAQWGLKHKSYTGPLLSFADWLPTFGDNKFAFYPSLAPWQKAFGRSLRVFNFDTSGDVVQHFLTVNDIHNVPSIRENVSPDSVTMAAQAVYNARKVGPVRPQAFDMILRRGYRGDENGQLLPPLDQMLPTEKILDDLVRERQEDVRQVNELLEQSGEPPLSFDPPSQQPKQPSSWEMEQFLLKQIFSMSEQMLHLRRKLAKLEGKIADLQEKKSN